MTSAPGSVAVLCGRTLPALATAIALLAAGCGGPTESAPPPPAPTAVTGASTQHFTVQQLAAAIGCQPPMIDQATDYREARCTVDGAEFVLLDSDTPEVAHAWVDYAVQYGETVCLAGDRWALSTKSKEHLERLQATLGGEVRDIIDHGISI